MKNIMKIGVVTALVAVSQLTLNANSYAVDHEVYAVVCFHASGRSVNFVVEDDLLDAINQCNDLDGTAAVQNADQVSDGND